MTITLATLQSEPTKPNLDRIITYLNQPVWARRFISGLVPSNNGTDAANDLDFTVGVAADLTGDKIMELGSAMTKRLDTAWSEGTGGGSLDTGAVADTVYHVWLIKNPKSQKVDILSSLSASAPTMPTGYSIKRRIFSLRRASSTNQVFTAVEISGGGLLVQIAPQIDSGIIKDWTAADNTAQTGTSAVVPSGVQMLGHWTFLFYDDTPAAVSALLVSSFDVSDVAPVAAVAPITTALADAIFTTTERTMVFTKSVLTRASDAAIRYRGSATTVDHSLGNTCHGWTDFRVS